MTTPLRFAIIGCGVISDWHAQSIRSFEDMELVGATDVYPPSLERFTQKYGIRGYASLDELLADPQVDVVCICTPSGLHAEACVKAANAGKHIIVEKPMALTHAQCDAVIEAVERNGVKLACISQNRTTDTVQYLRKALEVGRLGKLVCCDMYMKYARSVEYYKSGAWRGTWEMDGGGALMNQGIHGVDILQYVCGPVKSVFCHAETLVHDIQVEDTLSAVLTFENGALGILQATTSLYPGYERRLEVNGSNGSVTLTGAEITEWNVRGEDGFPDDLPHRQIIGNSSSDPTNFTIDGHKLQFRDMADAIRENRKPMVDHWEGKVPVDIILACYESAQSGKEVFLR